MNERVTAEYPKGTPGSLEAIEQGCLCPRMDNNNGRGVTLNGNTMFWFVSDCPVHQSGQSPEGVALEELPF